MHISVVIPCHNEANSIAHVIEDIRKGWQALGRQGEIIVVDNCSTDETAKRASAAGARVEREERMGYGSAIRRGFAEASGDILVMGDGDASYDFSRLDILVRPIIEGDADFVIGNRMGNIQDDAMPWLHRHIGNPLLSGCLRLLFRTRAVHDAHCGLRAIRRDAYERLGCVTTGMEFASEMVIAAVRSNLRIAEVPIEYHPRIGDSKLRSFRDGWRHLRFMLLHSPTLIVLVPGLIFWLFSMMLVARLAIGPIPWGQRLIDIHAMVIAGVLNMVSMQVVTLGMIAKVSAHVRGIRHDPVVQWFYRIFTYEKFTAAAVFASLTGAIVIAWVVWIWARGGFGNLDQARPMFFGALAMVNGVQLAVASYVFSVMALPIDIGRTKSRIEDQHS